MRYGKLFLAFLGLLYLGPIGLVLGLIFGHILDQGSSVRFYDQFSASSESIKRTKKTFFNVTFEVMGHVAKSDGRVTEKEITAARNIMRQMQLSEQQIKLAITNFTKGKGENFSLHDALNRLIVDCRHNRGLLQTFVEIQFRFAKTDGIVNQEKKIILQTICNRLGFSPNFSFEYEDTFNQQRRTATKSGVNSISQAYKILGVPENATRTDIKKKYRKLMNQHHPDKLIAKGLPDEMIKIATEKTQKIQAAYDKIKEHKGF